MNRRDAAALVCLAGVAALWSSLSGAVLEYLRPGMRPWVGAAGFALVVIGVLELWASRRERSNAGHSRSTRLGWLLAVPICVGVTVGSGSLGVYAVDRNATFRNLPDGPTSFDLEQYVRASSFGGQPVELTLVDLVSAAATAESSAILESRALELTGFLVRADDGSVRLTRFVISCCAADGAVVQVVLESGQSLPEDGTWLRLIGTLSPPASGHVVEADLPNLLMDSYRVIPEPDHPYEIPVTRIR